MEKRPTIRVIAFILAGIAVVGCGGENRQASPTSPAANSDLTGTWTQVGGTRTWTLKQVSVQVAGTASFSQDNNPSFGAVSATGGVVGAAAFGGFTFAETYERLSGP